MLQAELRRILPCYDTLCHAVAAIPSSQCFQVATLTELIRVERLLLTCQEVVCRHAIVEFRQCRDELADETTARKASIANFCRWMWLLAGARVVFGTVERLLLKKLRHLGPARTLMLFDRPITRELHSLLTDVYILLFTKPMPPSQMLPWTAEGPEIVRFNTSHDVFIVDNYLVPYVLFELPRFVKLIAHAPFTIIVLDTVDLRDYHTRHSGGPDPRLCSLFCNSEEAPIPWDTLKLQQWTLDERNGQLVRETRPFLADMGDTLCQAVYHSGRAPVAIGQCMRYTFCFETVTVIVECGIVLSRLKHTVNSAMWKTICANPSYSMGLTKAIVTVEFHSSIVPPWVKKMYGCMGPHLHYLPSFSLPSASIACCHLNSRHPSLYHSSLDATLNIRLKELKNLKKTGVVDGEESDEILRSRFMSLEKQLDATCYMAIERTLLVWMSVSIFIALNGLVLFMYQNMLGFIGGTFTSIVAIIFALFSLVVYQLRMNAMRYTRSMSPFQNKLGAILAVGIMAVMSIVLITAAVVMS